MNRKEGELMEDVKASPEAPTSSSKHELPPEHPTDIWTRRFVILAFWVVAICLGLPHWTWTTSIHRSTLPIDSMNAWAEGRACEPHFPLRVSLVATHLLPDQRSVLASRLENLLNRQAGQVLHTFSVIPESQVTSDGSALTVNLETSSESDSPKATLRTWAPILDVSQHLTFPDNVESVAAFIAREIADVFDDEGASLSYLLHDSHFSSPISRDLSSDQRAKLDRRTTRAFKYAPSYHLTFSLFTPTASPSAWDIDGALQKYVKILLEPLSAISDFTIDTQVQLFASFSPSIPGPFFDETSSQWNLQHEDLTGFVNAAEWPLSPSIGSGPTINFILYVPSPEQSPLKIAETGGTNWIIPQWGGVQIHNLDANATAHLTVDDLADDMLIFADQLAALLGVPPTPPSLSFRISSLARGRATSLILSASSTLGALARLTLKLTSIAIPDSVANSVDETIHRLHEACRNLNEGQYESALKNARIAEVEVEKAFFEPSMVGQVYFPEEHKVAVYVPLLGPMAVPLIMSGIKELRKLRGKKTKTM